MRKYLLVIECKGKTITEDMFQSAFLISLLLDKPMKIYIFKEIFQHFEQESDLKDELVQFGHDKFGWEVWKQFLDKKWKNLKGK